MAAERQECVRFFLILLVWFAHARCAVAELVALDIHHREPFAGGVAFGEIGPYEKLVGVARFAVDPKHPGNKCIVDLDLAPLNAERKVEFASDVYLLTPKDRKKANGALLYDVNNRGNKLALSMFNSAVGSNDPKSTEHCGNGFLFRRGYTILWSGWIGELTPGNDKLLLKAPIATEGGKPVVGVVRYELSTDKVTEELPLSRREGMGSYSPTKQGEEQGILTWRLREGDARIPIPRSQWSLRRIPIPTVERGVAGTLGQIRLKLSGGFRPGYLYELIAEAEGPIVQGLGFAGVRDLVSFLRYSDAATNPLQTGDRSAIARTHAFGVSQSGRLLRHFLYLGFNADEQSRRVFDGMMPHVAGGGLGYFNHRFAQPTRHNGQHEEHLYPADVFPFTYGTSRHAYLRPNDHQAVTTSRSDGILTHAGHDAGLQPRLMHTQSAAEYWHRSGSLVHTNPNGTHDEEIPENVRIYAFGGTQHGPAGFPPSRSGSDNLANPGDYRPLLRALLDALDTWVRDGTAPPPNMFPRIDRGTLAEPTLASTGFPAIPGVRFPDVIQQPSWLDHGPLFDVRGVATIEPPRIRGHYVVRVPKSGPDGNDLGCLLPPEVAVPIATCTGWNLRSREVGAEGMLASLLGSYLPFPLKERERTATGDPRKSIEELYGNFEEYSKRMRQVCDRMVRERTLLAEDTERILTGLRKRTAEAFPTP